MDIEVLNDADSEDTQDNALQEEIHMRNVEDQQGQLEFTKKRNALYLLKSKEKHLLTQTTLDGIVQDTTSLVRNTVEIIRKQVEDRLENVGMRIDAVPGLNELFHEDHSNSNPFKHVSTKSKQITFYRENFGLVVSTNQTT